MTKCRAGFATDREHSIAILLFNGITIRATDSDMKDYIHSTSCRRQFLLQHFSEHAERQMPKGHMCCDNCGKTCVCNNGYCNVNLYLPFSTREDVPQKTQPVTDEQKKELRVHLNILLKKLMMKTITDQNTKVVAVSFPNKVLEFRMKQIDDIIQHAHLIFGIEDVMKYIDIWQKKHAQLVIEIFVSLFGDIANSTEDDSSDDESSDEENVNDCDQVVEDPSYLHLLNIADWHINSLSFEESQQDNSSSEHCTYLQNLERLVDKI